MMYFLEKTRRRWVFFIASLQKYLNFKFINTKIRTIGSSSPSCFSTWSPEKVPDVKQCIILFKEIPLGLYDEEDAPVQNAYFVRQKHDTEREKYLDLWQSICPLSQCALPCWEYHMHRQQGIPLGVHALLWWPVLIRARLLCFHPSDTERLCSEAVVTSVACPSGYA